LIPLFSGEIPSTFGVDRLRVGWLNGRGTTRAEDAQGTPTQSHISPSILVYEEKRTVNPIEAELGPAS